MREYHSDEFEALVGEPFEVDYEGTSLSFTLARHQKLPRAWREGGGFRLDWTGPGEPVLPQAVYTFRHRTDTFEMFIVAVGKGPEGTQYEAIFS